MIDLSAATVFELLAASAWARFIPAYFPTNIFDCSVLSHCPNANIESGRRSTLLFGELGTSQKLNFAAGDFIGIRPFAEHGDTFVLLLSEHCGDGFSRQVAQSHAEKTELMKRLIATSSSDEAGISIIESLGIAFDPEIRVVIEALMSSRLSDPKSRNEQATRRRLDERHFSKRAVMILSKVSGLFWTGFDEPVSA